MHRTKWNAKLEIHALVHLKVEKSAHDSDKESRYEIHQILRRVVLDSALFNVMCVFDPVQELSWLFCEVLVMSVQRG